MEEEKRRKLFALFEAFPDITNEKAADLAGLHRNTASRLRKKLHQCSSTSLSKTKPGSGPKVNKNNVRKVIRSIKQNPGTSDRDRSRNLGILRSTV
jgi:hypothetical protein